MSFPKLEVYRKDTEVATLLNHLENYFHDFLKINKENPPKEINTKFATLDPYRVAREINTSKERASTLLFISQEAGVLVSRYDIFCPETEYFIKSFYVNEIEKLPQKITCENHSTIVEHDISECLIALVYEFSSEAIKQYA